MRIMAVAQYQILALDVDGTLLDPDGTLRPRTAAAVARAAKAGIRPVLCTGRRYRRALPIAQQLGIDAPLVCNSGAIVKDPKNHRTLWRADFDDSLATDVLDLFRGHDQPAVVFTDRGPHEHDFIIAAFPTGREHFDDYVGQNREHAEIDANGRWRTAVAQREQPTVSHLRHRHRERDARFRGSRSRAIRRSRSDLRAAQSPLSRHHVRGLAP